jgi:hypothetical protein
MESGQVNIKLLGQEKGVRVQKLAATLQDQQPNESEFFDVEWTSSGVQTIPSINNMPAEHVWLNCSREGQCSKPAKCAITHYPPPRI